MVYFGNKPMTRPVRHLCSSLQDETEVYNTVRCILNKLTPEKFDILVSQISSAPLLRSMAVVARIIDLIIDKASEEELYSNLYAEFCRVLLINECCSSEDSGLVDGEAARFRRLDLLLLGSPDVCSRFETALADKCSSLFDYYLIQLEHNPSNRDEEQQRVFRKKAVGFMKFVGELYRSEVVNSGYMVDMFRTLCDSLSASRVELATKLLTTAGQILEKSTHFSTELSEVWGLIWRWLEDAKSEDWCSTRLKYSITDVFELKSNNWTLRKSLRDRQPGRLVDIRLQLETESSVEMEMAVRSQQSMANEIEERLVEMLLDADQSMSQTYDWIKVYLDQNQTSKVGKHLAVFALTRAILKTSQSELGVLELPEDKLKILKDTIGGDIEMETVCVNALQNLIIVHLGSPQGLLYRAFDRLYRSGVLSREGFIRWKEGPELPPLPKSRHEMFPSETPSLSVSSHFLLGSEGRNRATVIAAAYLLTL